jgi:hypothetical protein
MREFVSKLICVGAAHDFGSKCFLTNDFPISVMSRIPFPFHPGIA